MQLSIMNQVMNQDRTSFTLESCGCWTERRPAELQGRLPKMYPTSVVYARGHAFKTDNGVQEVMMG